MTAARRRRESAPPPPAPAGPSHAQLYRDAVWESELSPTQKLMALCFANHARGGEVAWVTWRRLQQQMGVKSQDTVARVLGELVKLDWLVPVGPRLPRRKAFYRLILPDESAPMSGAHFQDWSAPVSGADDDPSAPIHGSICSDPQANLLRSTGESAPMIGADSFDSRDSLGPERQANTTAASLRAAAAFAEDHPGDSPVIADAKRQIRDALKGKRRAELSRWPRKAAPAGEPPAEPEPSLNGHREAQ